VGEDRFKLTCPTFKGFEVKSITFTFMPGEQIHMVAVGPRRIGGADKTGKFDVFDIVIILDNFKAKMSLAAVYII